MGGQCCSAEGTNDRYLVRNTRIRSNMRLHSVNSESSLSSISETETTQFSDMELEYERPTESVMNTAKSVNSDHELEIDIEEVLMEDDHRYEYLHVEY